MPCYYISHVYISHQSVIQLLDKIDQSINRENIGSIYPMHAVGSQFNVYNMTTIATHKCLPSPTVVAFTYPVFSPPAFAVSFQHLLPLASTASSASSPSYSFPSRRILHSQQQQLVCFSFCFANSFAGRFHEIILIK